jgi:hypothetical protein
VYSYRKSDGDVLKVPSANQFSDDRNNCSPFYVPKTKILSLPGPL